MTSAPEDQPQEMVLESAAVFLHRMDGFASSMPEHPGMISLLREESQKQAEGLGSRVEEIVDSEAGSLTLRLVDSNGHRYQADKPDEVDEATKTLAVKHGLNPKGALHTRVKQAASDTITDDRRLKIDRAEAELQDLVEAVKVPKKTKAAFVAETQDEYWRRAELLLDGLDKIADTPVASLRERAAILGGVAINRPMGPLHKYETANDRHSDFASKLNRITLDLSNTAEAVERDVDREALRERFPQLDPSSQEWQTKLSTIATRLDTDLESRDYMSKLNAIVDDLVAGARRDHAKRQAKSGIVRSEKPNYPAPLRSSVDGAIRKLRAEGLTDKAIYRQLSRTFHPEAVDHPDDAEQRFGYLAEWYGRVLKEANKKT
jgi:hypothetical protein